MLLCTILSSQRGSGLKVWVFGEKLGLKKKEKLPLKLNKSLGELQYMDLCRCQILQQLLLANQVAVDYSGR